MCSIDRRNLPTRSSESGHGASSGNQIVSKSYVLQSLLRREGVRPEETDMPPCHCVGSSPVSVKFLAWARLHTEHV